MNPYDIVGWQLVFILSAFILFCALTVVAWFARASAKRKARQSVSTSIDELNAFSEAVRAGLRNTDKPA